MTDTLKLEISGMSCQHCVGAVRKALASVGGVQIENVDIGKAELRYDPSQTTVAMITDAVADAGYSAEQKR